MKKLLLVVSLFFWGSTFSQQDVYPCHTDEKTSEYIESLSAIEKAQYFQQKANYEAEIQQFIADNPQLATNSNKRGVISYTIPVVFHIIHEGGEENISDQQVKDAVEFMNLDFQLSNTDSDNTVSAFKPLRADVEIEFKLAKLDPTGNCTSGITRTFSTSTSTGNTWSQLNAVIAAQGNWPGDKYLNIFVAKNIGGAAGFTTYPNTTNMGSGIFVLASYCGGTGIASPTTKHTLSHEAGHWLNLPHTWGNSNNPGDPANCDTDDGVADTPNTVGWSVCNLSGISCDTELDNVQNFMEYSYCSTMFTLGQKARMHAALNNPAGGRDKIWKSANLAATGVNLPETLCEVEFDADIKEVCAGTTITFEDLTYNAATGWDWEFPGGSPATSTQQNPEITYNTPGKYQVKLTATDGTNSQTETKTNYITVLPEAHAIPYVEGFEDVTNLSNTQFWSVENPDNNAKWETTTLASYSGNKSVRLANFGQLAGNVDAFVSTPIDLSSITDETRVDLTFKLSYRKRASINNEKLVIHISNNCGEIFTARKTFSGTSLGTTVSTSSWTPSSQDDWVTATVTNITSAYWVEDFRVKFVFESDGGNNIYIDDINIHQRNTPSNIEEEDSALGGLNVYPNPAGEYANIDFSVNHPKDIQISIVDMLGQVVQSEVVAANTGQNAVSLDVQNIKAGMYLVKVKSGQREQVKRLIIQ
ncbi:MAG: M43 family zinc metalloprotease [Brumimicrobium sp.]